MFDYFLSNLVIDVNNFSYIIAFTIFYVYLIINVMWTNYTLSVTSYKSGIAATTSLITYVLSALGIISVVENYLYLIPLAIGTWTGTYFMIQKVKYNHYNKHPLLTPVSTVYRRIFRP